MEGRRNRVVRNYFILYDMYEEKKKGFMRRAN